MGTSCQENNDREIFNTERERERISTPFHFQSIILHIVEVVKIAAMVPRGILRLGSLKSPLRFEPAMIPTPIEIRKLINTREYRHFLVLRTRDRWKINTNENKKCGDFLSDNLKRSITFDILFDFTFTTIMREEIFYR